MISVELCRNFAGDAVKAVNELPNERSNEAASVLETYDGKWHMQIFRRALAYTKWIMSHWRSFEND